MVPIPDGALKGGRTQETGRVSDVLGNSLIGGPKRELQNLGKLGKAGTWRAENRETCTSQPINSSQTVPPAPDSGFGEPRKAHRSPVVQRA